MFDLVAYLCFLEYIYDIFMVSLKVINLSKWWQDQCIYPVISFKFLLGTPVYKKKKKSHFTSQAADLSWQDIIGLQSSFHREFSAWHTSNWVGQACRCGGRWSRGLFLLIIVFGICKGHLQKSLRHEEIWLHLHLMIALWAEYNRFFPSHWSDRTLKRQAVKVTLR